jgi:hypothetical protein
MGRDGKEEGNETCRDDEQPEDGKERPERKTRNCDRNEPEDNTKDPLENEHLTAVHTITSINCWQAEQYNDLGVAFYCTSCLIGTGHD